MTDRLWDSDVQKYIEACKHELLRDIRLGYTVLNEEERFLDVSASFPSRRGYVAIGYRWAESSRYGGWLPEVFVGGHTAPAGLRGGFGGIAWRAGLWRERKDLARALAAVTDVFFKAQVVRAGLGQSFSDQCLETRSPGSAQLPENAKSVTEQGHVLTLQTLNDLAYLYSGDRTATPRP